MHLQIYPLEIILLKLSAKRERSLATVALARRQLAAQLSDLCEQKANEPTAPLLSILTQAVELLLRRGDLLKLPGHQIEKVNAA